MTLIIEVRNLVLFFFFLVYQFTIKTALNDLLSFFFDVKIWQKYTVKLPYGRHPIYGTLFLRTVPADRPNIAYHKTIVSQETDVLFEIIIYALF